MKSHTRITRSVHIVVERGTLTEQKTLAKVSKEQVHRERRAVNRDGVPHQVLTTCAVETELDDTRHPRRTLCTTSRC